MEKRKRKYIISVAILMLLSIFAFTGCKKNQDKEQKDTEIDNELQVEESGEGESATFEEIFSTESEDNKADMGVTEQKKPSSEDTVKEDSDKKDNNGQDDVVTEQKKPSSEDTVKEDSDKKDPNEQDNNQQDESGEKEHITGEEEDKEHGWGPII